MIGSISSIQKKRRVMNVPVNLISSTTCFVNLPKGIVSITPNLNPGYCAIEVSWQDLTSDSLTIKRAYAGWIGGISLPSSEAMEIPIHMARCMGLFAEQIEVEPYSIDDWEILELNAEYIETTMLKQINVVYPGMKIPIWISEGTIAHMNMVTNFQDNCLRIGRNTQVIVSPKVRQDSYDENGAEDNVVYQATPPLRLQPATFIKGDIFSGALECAQVDLPHSNCVLLHPETMATIDGLSLDRRIAAVWSHEDPSLAESPFSMTGHAIRRKRHVVVVTLVASSSAAPNHILMHPLLCQQLEISPLCLVRLRLLSSTPENIDSIQLSRLYQQDNNTGKVSMDEDQIVNSFRAWCRSTKESIPVTSNSFISFQVDDDTNRMENFAIHIKEKEADEDEASFLGDKIGCSIPYYVLNLDLLDRIQLTVSQPTLSSTKIPSHLPTLLYRNLGGMKDILRTLNSNLAPLVNRRVAGLRLMMGLPPMGSLYLYGQKGCGKTATLQAICEMNQYFWETFCSIHYVDCRNLRGNSMSSVKGMLAQTFEKAVLHAPSIIVLDDMDTLIPCESNEPGAPNQQSQQLADYLADLLLQNRQRNITSFQHIRDHFALEKNLQGTNCSMDIIHMLEDHAVYQGVMVLASGKSLTSIHQSLRAARLFDQSLALSLPDSKKREQIMQALLLSRKETMNLETSLDLSALSSLTEGYSAKDLSNVLETSIHKAMLRIMKCRLSDAMKDNTLSNHHDTTSTTSSSTTTLNNQDTTLPSSNHEKFSLKRKDENEICNLDDLVQLTQSDVIDTLKTFTPASLRGVKLFKSDVQWEDIGGLTEVKNVLRETLELPIKYSKLYESSPIKLASGILLYGPPGCGKTLLAGAVASSFKINFISVKGPEVLDKYIGASEQAVRDLFSRAAAAAPCILFLDEFDSIAPRRGADNTGVTDRVVNQLLTFLDGVESREGVYVLAATSRPDMIDPALLRPGRLDKTLYCGFPDQMERLDILKAISRKMNMSEEGSCFLSTISSSPQSCYYSGADLNALMYSAQLETVHMCLADSLGKPHHIGKEHLLKAFQETRPSVSTKDRLQFERIYSSFTRSRTTAFATATGEVSCKHQRTALA